MTNRVAEIPAETAPNSRFAATGYSDRGNPPGCAKTRLIGGKREMMMSRR